MSFTNYVCWDKKRVQTILNVEAIENSDHVFLATHHPIKMRKNKLIRDLINEQTGEFYREEEFLEDFLASQDFAFVPVLGNSGTGKSHLIRWLSANIQATKNRKVLLIPKIGTNLKDIIRMILDIPELIEPHFQEYKNRLERATNTLDENEAREQLLNQLAIAIQRERPNLTEIQEYLVEELSSLLYDPYFRKEHWLKNGSIIQKLATHILGNKNTLEMVEERREFTLKDLPLNVTDCLKAGAQARDFYTFLIGDNPIQKATIDWLNLNLDQAISKVLDLGSEDLQILMREVRESLAEKEIELVLLIEDFAKLQGIDRQVLEAVLARPQQVGNKPLCAVRTALACTTGYFRGLLSSYDTVQQRVTFTVNLDVGFVTEQSLFTDTDIQAFTARYLNAVKLPESELINWHNEPKETGLNRKNPPSFCDECEHRETCHQGFGQINGMGLYPFNFKALKQMLNRVNQGQFNPRIFLKDVLKYTLENSANPIQDGNFPTKLLQAHFGKMRLSALVQDDIKQKDPLNGDRRQVLLDLWTDSDSLIDLPSEVHTVFNLPPLGVKVQKNEPQKLQVKETNNDHSYQIIPPKKEDSAYQKLSKQLEMLDNWNNQAIIPQDIERDLRTFIYPAILERIDWDTEHLLRGSFATSTASFKQRNVLIYSPRTRGQGANYSGIILNLPLNPDDEQEFRETAIAFQGILQFNYYKHWNFDNGDHYFRVYAKQIEQWSEYIIDQIRQYPRDFQTDWNPVPATVELMAMTAIMSGLPSSNLEDLINSLFLELEDNNLDNRTKTWQELFKHLQSNQKKLLDIFKSFIGCTKGSNSNFQMIDVVQIIEPLKGILKTGKPQEIIPETLTTEYQIIAKVRQKIDELLAKVIQEESEYQLNIYENLIVEFGRDMKKQQVINTVKIAIEEARNAGSFGLQNSEKLLETISEFQKTRFSGYVDNMKRIKLEQQNNNYSMYEILPYLSQNYQKAIQTGESFLTETNQFLSTSLDRVQQDINKLKTAESGNVELTINEISNNLIELNNLLQEI